ncbi:MAG: hypothetical protein E7G73_01585, partial [Peptostreptococcus sp.]|nr:hypothetical protein [Peptostreptococcus sp.]
MKKKLIMILAAPLVILGLYFGLVYGYINPMVKGLDIHINGGTFITNINKYVIKVGDRVNISMGDYIVVPNFSKKPKLMVAVLDQNNILKVEGNQLTALKKGYSSIGILNKNRVLRKVAIMVVDPKISNMEIALESPLEYYGDSTRVNSKVDIEKYKKLEKGYKLTYSSTQPNILKIDGDQISAVGVGETRLIARYGRQEIQSNIKILPRVDELELPKSISIEEGQTGHASANIKVSPQGSRSVINYRVDKNSDDERWDSNLVTQYGDSGLEKQYGIVVDKNGNIQANRPGIYKLKVRSGRKSDSTFVHVTEKKFENLDVQNLNYSSKIDKDKLKLELGWDHNKRIKSYRMYIKKGDGDFELQDIIKTDSFKAIPKNRISINKYLDLGEDKSYKYELYLVGISGDNMTRKSNTLVIDSSNRSGFQEKA